jgi:hypothetical protein
LHSNDSSFSQSFTRGSEMNCPSRGRNGVMPTRASTWRMPQRLAGLKPVITVPAAVIKKGRLINLPSAARASRACWSSIA